MLSRRNKSCSIDDAAHQIVWLRAYPDVSPRGVRLDDFGYSYEYVEGECPVDPSRVPQLLAFCERKLWCTDDDGLTLWDIEWPRIYWAYLCDVRHALGLDFDAQVKGWFVRHMHQCQFTPVVSCHGDLTLENVVRVGERFIFIDPGYARSLPCRELDEAKVMQSLEELNEGQWRALPVSGETAHWYVGAMASLPHRVLLASHYLRLLRHAAKHPAWRAEHAARRLKELTS